MDGYGLTGDGLRQAEARQQRILGGTVLGVCMVVCAAFSVFDLLVTGYVRDALAEALGVVVFGFCLHAMLRGRAARTTLHVVVCTTMVMILVAVSSGREIHAILVWPLVMPPLAFLLIGARWGWLYVVITGLGSLWLLHTDGTDNVVLLANFGGAYGVVALLTLYFETARAHAFRALRHVAETDALTGALTRVAFQARYESVQNPVGQAGPPLALLTVGVDRLDELCAARGGDMGERTVAGVAGVLAAGLRAGDALGRVRNGTFAILLPATGLPQAVALAEAWRRAVAEDGGLTHDLGVGVTISVGVVPAGPVGEGFDTLLARADGRLVTAREAGGNRVVADDRLIAATEPLS